MFCDAMYARVILSGIYVRVYIVTMVKGKPLWPFVNDCVVLTPWQMK
jgi:hypothetical protein